MLQQKKQKWHTIAAKAQENPVEAPKKQAGATEGPAPVESPRKVGGHAGDSSADRARKASDAVLGNIVGIARPIAIPDLPEDEIELSVEEDRRRLVLQGLLLAVAVLALLLLAFWCGIAANYSGNVWLLLALIASLTAAWFVSKRMGRLLRKYFMRTGVIDFGHTYVYIYEKADPKEATVVTYKDIKAYKVVRQGNSLRLLLWGDWVKHPSGYLYVGITRPFMAGTLDSLEQGFASTMARHHVKEKK